MGKSKHVIGHNSKSTVTRQIGHFIIHLRWHYQVFILSSGFLLGGYFSTGIDWPTFLVQFANVHLLLFGGATAYNSYWDQDCGPVGGLKHPPPMRRWMWTASLFLQIAGIFIASFEGLVFALIYLTSMTFYWLYSTPHFRWKAHPSRSFAAIGLSSGVAPLLLGYLAAGNVIINYRFGLQLSGQR
jgi:heme O synthase-like polyprenyltransferase